MLSAIVVGITPEQDYPKHVLAGIDLQRTLGQGLSIRWLQLQCSGTASVGDFLPNRPSQQLAEVSPSYRPNIALGDLSAALPEFAITVIRERLFWPLIKNQRKLCRSRRTGPTGVETEHPHPSVY